MATYADWQVVAEKALSRDDFPSELRFKVAAIRVALELSNAYHDGRQDGIRSFASTVDKRLQKQAAPEFAKAE